MTLVFKERQGPEGFLGFLAYLALVDHLASRVTGVYQGIMDLLGWVWRDQLDQQDLMDPPVLLGPENLEHRALEDHLGNTVSVCISCVVFCCVLHVVQLFETLSDEKLR